MESPIVLVNLAAATDFQDMVARELVAQYLASSGGEVEDVLRRADYATLVSRLLPPLTASLTTAASTTQQDQGSSGESTESAFSLLFRLIEASNEAQIVPVICESLVKLQTAPQRIIAILTNLYSVLPSSSPARFGVLISIVRYATVTDQTNVIAISPDDEKQIEALLSQFGDTGVKKHRELLIALYEAMKKAKKDDDANKFLILYLQTFGNASSTSELDEAVEYARSVAISAVKNPLILTQEYMDILQLAPVQRLAAGSGGTDSKIFRLLSIFCTGDLDSFDKFEQENVGFVKSLGLDPASCVENIRLLTLVSLAADHDRISYAQVASALKVEKGRPVEQWVIKALVANLIDVKMDQLHETIIVNRATQRVFTDEQWANLGKRMNQWRLGVRKLLQTLQTSRETQGQNQSGPSGKEQMHHQGDGGARAQFSQ